MMGPEVTGRMTGVHHRALPWKSEQAPLDDEPPMDLDVVGLDPLVRRRTCDRPCRLDPRPRNRVPRSEPPGALGFGAEAALTAYLEGDHPASRPRWGQRLDLRPTDVAVVGTRLG